MSKSPLDVLLNGGRRRLHGLRLTTLVTLGVAVVLGGPEFVYLKAQGERAAGAETIEALSVVLLMVLPFLAAGNLFRVLENLRRSHMLADIQLTTLRPAAVCDQLAWRAVGSVAAPAGVFAIGLYGVDDLPSALRWYLGMLLATLAIAYLSEVHALGQSRAGLLSRDRLLVWLLALISAVPLVAVAVNDPDWNDWVSGVGISLLLLAIVSRVAALFCFQHGDAPVGAVRLLSRFRPEVPNRWLSTSSGNPIVFRSMAATAARIPWGWIGVLLWRFDVVLLAVPLLLLLPPQVGAVVALQVIATVYSVRVAWACWQGVVRDRPHLELLSTTTLSPTEYVEGLARSAALPRLVPTCVSLVLVSLSLGGPESLWCGLCLGIGLLFGLPLMVYGTLYLAARCRNWVEAIVRFYLAMFLGELVVVVPGAVITLWDVKVGLAFTAIWLLTAYVAALNTARGLAIQRVGGPLA